MREMAVGLTLLPKLKREHIWLTSYSKMRVDLAVQVCSSVWLIRSKCTCKQCLYIEVLVSNALAVMLLGNRPANQTQICQYL